MEHEPTRQLDADYFEPAAKVRKSNAFHYLPLLVVVGVYGIVEVVRFVLAVETPAWFVYIMAPAVLLSAGIMYWNELAPGAADDARDAWLEIADEFGLITGVEVVDNVPTMAGEIDGRRVEMNLGAGKVSTTGDAQEPVSGTEYRIELSERWNPLTLAVRGSLYFDESEGDELGEGDVRLYGAVDDELVEKLDRPEVIDAARRLVEEFGEVRIGHGDIEAEKGGVALSADELGGEVEKLLEVAEIFDDALDDPA